MTFQITCPGCGAKANYGRLPKRRYRCKFCGYKNRKLTRDERHLLVVQGWLPRR